MAYTECEKKAYLDAKEFFKRNPKIYTHYFPTSDKQYCRHDTYAVNYTGGTELVELKKETPKRNHTRMPSLNSANMTT